MSSEDLQSSLPETEQWLLNCFINRFLPKSNNRRKYIHNELSFIHTVISKIFFRFRRVKITFRDLLICFAQSGYEICVRNQPVGNKQQDDLSKTELVLEMDCVIYVGISSAHVLNLKKSISSIAYQKNRSKIDELSLLKKEIYDFFIWNARVAP